MAVTAVGILPALLVGAVAVQMAPALGLSLDRLGAAVAVFYAAGGAFSIPGGRIVERFGSSLVMRGSVVVLGVACLGLAATAASWVSLLPWLVVMGMATASATPAVNLYLSRAVPRQYLATIFGVKQSATPLAALLGGAAVPALALTVGWRWAFVAAAALSIATVAFLPRDADRIAPVVRPQAARRTAHLPLVVLALGFGLGQAAATALGAFLVSASVAVGLGESDAGTLLAVASLAGVAARLLQGVLADRRGSSHFIVVAAMLGVGALGYGTLALATTEHLLALFVTAAVLSLAMGWGWNGLFNFAVIDSHRGAEVHATAVTQMGAYTGGIVGPFGFGLIAAATSFPVAWTVCAAAALLAAALMLSGSALARRAALPATA